MEQKKKSKLKIVFDFDHTLFSTTSFFHALRKEFKKLGVDEDLYYQTWQKTKKSEGYYIPEKHFELICQIKPEIKTKDLERSLVKVLKQITKFFTRKKKRLAEC